MLYMYVYTCIYTNIDSISVYHVISMTFQRRQATGNMAIAAAETLRVGQAEIGQLFLSGRAVSGSMGEFYGFNGISIG